MHSIYLITNKANGKKYFGYSKQPLLRWKNHKNNKNNDCPHLHRALKKYGSDNFTFNIIYETLDKNEALDKEKFFIKENKTNNPKYGYNISKGGEPGGFVSEEHRLKVIKRMKSNKNPMKILKINSGSFKPGHKPTITKERNKKISLSKIGNKNHNFKNKKASEHLNNEKIKCTKCGIITNLGNAKRWHFDKCKLSSIP
jgi:group I intron endonuclease